MTAAFFPKKTQTSAVGRGLGADLPPPPPAPRPRQRPPPSPRPGHGAHWHLGWFPICRYGRFASAVHSLFSIFSASLRSAFLSSWRGPKAKGRTGSSTEVPQEGGPSRGGRTWRAEAPSGSQDSKESTDTNHFARDRSRAVFFDKEVFFALVESIVSVLGSHSDCGCRFYFPVAWENVILANALNTFHQTKYSQKFSQMSHFLLVNGKGTSNHHHGSGAIMQIS